MKTVVRYLRLWGAFLQNCLMREMEFRSHFVLTFIMDILWYAVQLGLFEVLYLHTTAIAGFSHADMLVFLGTLYVTDAIDMVLFSSNFWRFPEYVRTGELDFFLLRPVHPAFSTMLRYVNIPSLANLLFAIGFLLFAISVHPDPFPLDHTLAFLLFLALGTLVTYFLQLFFAALSIFLVATEGIQFVFYNISQLGDKPDVIYHRTFQRMLYTIFPLALIASVPAQVLLGKLTILDIWWTIPLVAVLLWLTLRFFDFALRHYSSVNS